MEGTFRCGNCEDRVYDFEFAIAAYHAQGAAREVIHRFKYGRDLGLRACAGHLMLRVFEDARLAGQDLSQWRLVPVPLHPARRREREFNQSEELCRVAAQHTGIRVANALKRPHPTRRQARLTRAQRLKNLKSAFEVRRGYRGEKGLLVGRSVFLVDDVFTTGATAHACAQVLKRRAGVEKVVVITVARG
jgi:ComF family protein